MFGRLFIQHLYYVNNNLHSIYIALGIINNLEMILKYTGGYMKVICKYCAILYEGLEHSWILVSKGDPRTNPPWILRDNCIIFYEKYIFKITTRRMALSYIFADLHNVWFIRRQMGSHICFCIHSNMICGFGKNIRQFGLIQIRRGKEEDLITL